MAVFKGVRTYPALQSLLIRSCVDEVMGKWVKVLKAFVEVKAVTAHLPTGISVYLAQRGYDVTFCDVVHKLIQLLSASFGSVLISHTTLSSTGLNLL